jgi:hypothetical protein
MPELSGRARLEEVLSAEPPERLVAALVECLDDPRPSSVTLDGRRVPLGMVCFEGLRQLAYYEPSSADGDIAADWEGHVEPGASIEELRRAKAAWQKVVDARAYILL